MLLACHSNLANNLIIDMDSNKEPTEDKPEKLSSRGPHSVVVRVAIQGEERLLIGQGTFEHDSDLGSVLRVCLHSATGCEELLISESTWLGKPESGDALGCDYLI